MKTGREHQTIRGKNGTDYIVSAVACILATLLPGYCAYNVHNIAKAKEAVTQEWNAYQKEHPDFNRNEWVTIDLKKLEEKYRLNKED
ncbi:MAG: hypothetical protein WC533_03195 [Candidatus Pacearchaeota archaeon]